MNWFGVPMHAWNPKSFRLIMFKFGKLVCIEEDTLNRRNLHSAGILITTSYSEIPRNPFGVSIDGKVFYIKVREES